MGASIPVAGRSYQRPRPSGLHRSTARTRDAYRLVRCPECGADYRPGGGDAMFCRAHCRHVWTWKQALGVFQQRPPVDWWPDCLHCQAEARATS